MRPQHEARCRVLVAAAGYGKTTALRRWYPDAQWHRDPSADPAKLVLHAGADRIVLDDLPCLTADAIRPLLDVVADLPDGVTVVLASRWPPAEPAARFLGRGAWSRLGPADLALTPQQVGRLLATEYGFEPTAGDLAARVHEATGGWPALVHLTAEALRLDGIPDGSLAAEVARPGGPLAALVREEVVAALPPDVVRLARQVCALTPITAGLCRALGHRRADEAVRLLSRVGLLTRSGPHAAVAGGPAHGERIVPVVAEVLGHRRPPAVRTLATAARWYDENGPPLAAALAYHQAGETEQCARVLDERGASMLALGRAGAVADLVATIPSGLRTRGIRLLGGDALRTIGDLPAATAVYDAESAGCDAGIGWDAALAWRVGRIHYQRGDARAAIDTFARECSATAPSADVALLLAWTAHAHLLAGDAETATGYARRAVSQAVDSGDDAARATAHLSVALCLGVSGDAAGSAEQYAMAQPIAERCGDVVLLTRILINCTYHLLRTSQLVEALDTAQQSVRYAAAAGSPSLHAIATCNEADALADLGRYDEAVPRFIDALAQYQRIGSRRVAGVHRGLGEVFRRRGWREQARAAYEDAVRVSREMGNAHVLVRALAGLALVVLDDDPGAAARCAEEAARDANEEVVVPALLARGWVALHAGDRCGAEEFAASAARIARGQRDRAALADALELRAATATDPVSRAGALREAGAIWIDAGAAAEAARMRVLLGRLPGATPHERIDGLVAAETLAAAGAVVDRPGCGAGAGARPVGGEVLIQAFGRFEVRLDGAAVKPAQWQSRKARELLRILVARRGRPVPREELCDLLWPDASAGRAGHRLSVLLSIVRGVLDPLKFFGTDHYLVADQGSIALDVTRVQVDVEDFLVHAGHGRRLVERGDLAEARTLLTAVEREYRADVFEDEPYPQWSMALREEARAAYLDVLRMLAQANRAVVGPHAAVASWLRLLEKDPFDESAHRALVRTLVAGGQHGEARRAYDRYRDAMQTIGVRPPDGALLRPARP